MRVGPGGCRGMMPSVEKAAITADLASRLVAEQFPQWAGLPVRRVEPGGWDNVTFRLGADLSVRLPSGPGYAGQVDKEHRWLPVMARQLPLQIPQPLARGEPGSGFPWPWSVYRWLPGSTRRTGRPAHRGNWVPTSRDASSEVIAVRSTDGIIPRQPPGPTRIFR